MNTLKTCRRCALEKNLDEFYRRASSIDGYQDNCKDCHNKTCHVWNQANRERQKEACKAWRRANKDKAAAAGRAWRLANSERNAANNRAWYLANLTRTKEACKAWNLANPERVATYRRNWRQKNPDKTTAHRIVHRAIKAGELIRPDKGSRRDTSCKPEAHHVDYSRPLDVEFLCRGCHLAEHWGVAAA